MARPTNSELRAKLVDSIDTINGNMEELVKRMVFFHNYSFYNTFLIFVQRPDASHVAGYRKWQRMGRQVKKGSKAIYIYVPMRINTTWEDDEGEIHEAGKLIFKPGAVFAYEDTEGVEIPWVAPVKWDERPLTPQLLELRDDLTQTLLSGNVTAIDYKSAADDTIIERGAGGYYKVTKRSIVISADNPPAHQLHTLIHEAAHALLHDQRDKEGVHKLDYADEEILVEFATLKACATIGIDATDYASKYLWSWASTGEDILSVAKHSNDLATGLIGLFPDHSGLDEAGKEPTTKVPAPVSDHRGSDGATNDAELHAASIPRELQTGLTLT